MRQFHDDPFPVTNGVKQGCVLASRLLIMMFSAMLTDAFQDGDNSSGSVFWHAVGKLSKFRMRIIVLAAPIRYRSDGKLFNLRRLQTKSKVQTDVLDEFLFADDMAT